MRLQHKSINTPKYPKIPDYPFVILMIDDPGSSKPNAWYNLIMIKNLLTKCTSM